MVNIKDISAISGQSNSGQTARMQALQVAVAGELDKDAQKLGLIKQAISSGAPLVGEYLQRKAARDDSKREIERNKAYGNQVADYLGLPSISEIDKFQGLELQGAEGQDKAPTMNEQGQYQLGAATVPPIDPQKLALSRMIRDGTFSPKDINELDQMLAYGDEITPRGVKDKYTALNTKSEYQSLEGAPGTGTSRRNVSRDVDISKTQADIANTYDTMNKRVAGGSGGKAASNAATAAGNVASAWGSLEDSLVDINKSSNSATRASAGLLSKVSGGNLGGDLGNKVDAYDSLKNAVGVEIAKLGQSGNLTEGEQKRAFALLPNPTQSIARQEEQYRAFASYINSKVGYPVLNPSTNLSGRGSSAPNQGSQPIQRSDDAFRFKE